VLTKPSKGTKNDGYDNEDSDYILYVNDILGNEETGHKYIPHVEFSDIIPLLTVIEIATLFSMCWVKAPLDKS
jgi:hypothetical protein